MAERVGPPPRQVKHRRDSGEQSGSTGRNPGTGDPRQDGANTGQDRYGMTGAGDCGPPPTKDEDKDEEPKIAEHERRSNFGSGRADREVDGVDTPQPKEK
jgi:hypothetical protein